MFLLPFCSKTLCFAGSCDILCVDILCVTRSWAPKSERGCLGIRQQSSLAPSLLVAKHRPCVFRVSYIIECSRLPPHQLSLMTTYHNYTSPTPTSTYPQPSSHQPQLLLPTGLNCRILPTFDSAGSARTRLRNRPLSPENEEHHQPSSSPSFTSPTAAL